MNMNATEHLTDSHDPRVRYVGRIPVRNIWLLMLYASDLFRSMELSERSVEENPDEIPDLVAEILAKAVENRLKRNLSYGYQRRAAVLDRVRGRIDVLTTERHQLLSRGKIACRFDELTVNTPRNCYVRSALDFISKAVRRPDLARRCRILSATMKQIGVTGQTPTRHELSLDRLGRNDRTDRHLMAAAHLAYDLALPTEYTGSRYLSSPGREIHWIRKLYEKGVAGFYDVVLSGTDWSIHPGHRLHWAISAQTERIDKILPEMVCDIELNNHSIDQRIVIDTKFNSLLKKGWYRDESIRNQYLYQIYTYLRSQEKDEDVASINATGVLLHPSIGSDIDESVVIQGHRLRFMTVDLQREALQIREQLLRVTKDLGEI